MSRQEDDNSGKGWVEFLFDGFGEIFGGFLVDLLVFLVRGVGHLILGLLEAVFHIFD